jgi:hypothetical protein
MEIELMTPEELFAHNLMQKIIDLAVIETPEYPNIMKEICNEWKLPSKLTDKLIEVGHLQMASFAYKCVSEALEQAKV